MFAFPDNFLWGATTSSYCVEGGNVHSDWWHWEQRPGRIAEGASALEAAQFSKRFEADLAQARQLGHNAHLFTVEWSRVEPQPGRFDEAALEYYTALASAIVRNGMTPIAGLFHIALPRWFADRGGWARSNAAEAFNAFCARMAECLAPVCRWWLPLVAPMQHVTQSYLHAVWPPATASWRKAWRAVVQLARAQRAAYEIIHRAREDALVGLGVHARRFRPVDTNSPWDLRVARRETRRCTHGLPEILLRDRWQTWTGLKPGTPSCDFIGSACHGVEWIRFRAARPWNGFVSVTKDNGAPAPQELYAPDADEFAAALRELSEYGKPIIVTGNGLATADDAQRCGYLLDHVAALDTLVRDGLDIRGYLHRSLLDGFEWTRGYSARYGLLHVNHATQSRTPNPSALLFQELCTTGDLRRGTVSRFCPGWQDNRAPQGQRP